MTKALGPRCSNGSDVPCVRASFCKEWPRLAYNTSDVNTDCVNETYQAPRHPFQMAGDLQGHLVLQCPHREVGADRKEGVDLGEYEETY